MQAVQDMLDKEYNKENDDPMTQWGHPEWMTWQQDAAKIHGPN